MKRARLLFKKWASKIQSRPKQEKQLHGSIRFSSCLANVGIILTTELIEQSFQCHLNNAPQYALLNSHLQRNVLSSEQIPYILGRFDGIS